MDVFVLQEKSFFAFGGDEVWVKCRWVDWGWFLFLDGGVGIEGGRGGQGAVVTEDVLVRSSCRMSETLVCGTHY